MATLQKHAPKFQTSEIVGSGLADLLPLPDGQSQPERETFTIGDLTREFRVSARTLRFYEEKGLVSPERLGQERRYSRRDRARMRFALIGKAVGFSLDDIRGMLDLYDLGNGPELQMSVVSRRFREQIDRLKEQRRAIDLAIGELERAVRNVDDRLSRARAKTA